MKLFIRISVFILLLSTAITPACLTQKGNKADYILLNGDVAEKRNPIDTDGNTPGFTTPSLRLLRTKSKLAKGSVLLIPNGEYNTLRIKDEAIKSADLLNKEGYDVAMLEYPTALNLPAGKLALMDVLQAYRLLYAKRESYGFRGERFLVMGLGSGGSLAARSIQKLGDEEQPDDLILISPTELDETIQGTVYPAILPPLNPAVRLLCTHSSEDSEPWIKACQEYAKTWTGYGGDAEFRLLPDSAYTFDKDPDPVNEQAELSVILSRFLNTTKALRDSATNNPTAVATTNPAAVATMGNKKKRVSEKVNLASQKKFDLIMMGNSIIHNFEKPQYQAVWNQYFAARNALNFGFSGYRTENLIYDIQQGALDTQSPKVVVLQIGTNNVDEKNYPTRHTAAQLAGGIKTIVDLLHQKMPETKILLLRCFPGCYGGPNPTSHRLILERASDMVAKLADGEHVFYCDVNHVFLNLDGSINHEMMSDWLHPSPKGAKAWAEAMEPMLAELMGDDCLHTLPSNTAIIPEVNLENNSYSWIGRHLEVLAIKDSIDPEIVLIGNSITHMWGGEPKLRYADGRVRIPNGPKSWQDLFGESRVLNLGFGWDRTQNLLWRLDHGELDGLHPHTIILHIGTNNTSQGKHARINTPAEIVQGIQEICLRIRSKVPAAKIVLMAVFPREEQPEHPRRILINKINQALEAFAKEQELLFVDISAGMLAKDGTMLPDVTSDFCHPTEKGYRLWADTIRSILVEPRR